MIDFLLIDADSIIYRAGFNCEYHQTTLSKDGEVVQTKSKKEIKKLISNDFKVVEEEDILLPTNIAIATAKNQLHKIIESNPSRVVYVFLDPHTRSWRRRFYPDYKANRKQPKPKYYDIIYDYIETNYCVIKRKYHEADDMVSIYANTVSKDNCDYTIAGIDKDLRQIPGRHYSYISGEYLDINPWTADYNFYRQLLTGDVADNIPGLKGIGVKKSHAILRECDNEIDMWNTVQKFYSRIAPNLGAKDIILRATMLKLLTKQGEFKLWQPPI